MFPDTPGVDSWSHPLGMAATHTWLITNSMTNRFSYGLTRLAFSNQGDSSENAITLRDIFTSNLFQRTFSRVNPTQNFTDDFTWIKGNHTLQFGTNIRLIRNERTSLASAFDNGVANFGWYSGSGNVLTNPLNAYLMSNFGPNESVSSGGLRSAQSSLAAVLGRLSQYTANFGFDLEGNPIGGEPTVREFATEEYDYYFQDTWKIRPSLTLNLGLRYGVSTPVYETQGFQVVPNIALDQYFERRVSEAALGRNYSVPLTLDLAGPKHGRPGYYDWDLDNWQPRISVAWAPKFDGGLGALLFGRDGQTVLRGGFAITNDYYGQQLAVSFDATNTLGFNSSFTIPANTYNVTTNPAPLITSMTMDIRSLPGVVVPTSLTFPLQQPANNARRIENSIDRGIKVPTNYSWNLTYGRELPFKLYVEASYIGRVARNLLATRDVMTPNDIKDPVSGQTFNEAAGVLEDHRIAGTPWQNIPNIPFFENMYPTGSLNNWWGWPTALSNTQTVYQIMAIRIRPGPSTPVPANGRF